MPAHLDTLSVTPVEAWRFFLTGARRLLPGGAAILSAHAQRLFGRTVDWPVIAAMYDALVPTIGAMVGRAAALGEAHGSEAGLAALTELPSERVAAYQPYWALRRFLAGRRERARSR